MSKRESTFYLVDLFLAIYKIKKYTRAFSSAEALMYDELHWDAVMRELQIVGETISALQKQKILDDQYRKIVDFRNVITHAYFGIDKSVVWDVVINKLPKSKFWMTTIISLLIIAPLAAGLPHRRHRHLLCP